MENLNLLLLIAKNYPFEAQLRPKLYLKIDNSYYFFSFIYKFSLIFATLCFHLKGLLFLVALDPSKAFIYESIIHINKPFQSNALDTVYD